MSKGYSRDNLIKEVIKKYGRVAYESLPERPKHKNVRCNRCKRASVRVENERYGDGTQDYIYWACDVWVGICQMPDCGVLHLWLELIEQEILDQENKRLLQALCDRELKSL